MSYIVFSSVIKRYGHTLAVDNINMTVDRGEIFGLLGPNGAGKSTTIKMLVGLLKQSSGDILIDGIDIKQQTLKLKSKMGLVPQDLAFYESLSAYENVAYFGSLYGLKGSRLKEMTNEALEFTGLYDKSREKAKRFSGGMKRRLNIACSIVHQPEIIIMDEPTVGIDPQSRNHILNSVKELNSRGSTIIYTSHYMEEVEGLCKRIGIMDHGRLIAYGKQEELKKLTKVEEKIVVEVNEISYGYIDELKRVEGVTNLVLKDNVIEILTYNPQGRIQDVLTILSRNNIKIKNLALKEADLENIFLELTGRRLRD